MAATEIVWPMFTDDDPPKAVDFGGWITNCRHCGKQQGFTPTGEQMSPEWMEYWDHLCQISRDETRKASARIRESFRAMEREEHSEPKQPGTPP